MHAQLPPTDPLEIRPVTESDLTQAADWMKTIPMRVDSWRSQDTRAALATVGGEPIAVGIMWLPQLHDSHTEFRIATAPGMRINAALPLVEYMKNLRTGELPLMCRDFIDAPCLALMDLAGAHTLQMVPPAKIDLAHRFTLRGDAQAVAASSVASSNLQDALTSMYLWTHEAWSPVSDTHSPLIVDSLGFPDDVDMEASSVVARKNGTVDAMTIVFTDADSPCIIAETASRDTPDGERLIEACLRRSLDTLADQGRSTVEFDGHATDVHFFPTWMKLNPTGKWFRIVALP